MLNAYVVCALQLVRECKEVLKGGLLMKQYYQFMLRGVVTDDQGLQTNANMDEFEEDLHKMLVVRLNPVYLSQSVYALLKFKLNAKDRMVIPTSVTVFVGLL